jgi:hypothetical protein
VTPEERAAQRTAVVEALGVLGSGPEERFDRITQMAHEAFGVPLTFLNLVHHDLVTTQSTFGWNQGSSVPANEQFCATTVLTPDPMVIPDTTLDERFADTAAVAEHGIRFYAGAPLSMGDGTRVGTLCLMDAQPREFSDDDLALLRDLAHWAERELGHALDRDRVRHVLAGLLPEPVVVPGVVVDVLVEQRGQGGGTVADWRATPDGAVHVTVGSVAPAGQAAALLAADVRSAVIARTALPVAAAVAGVEAQVAPDLQGADAVTALLHARVAPDTGHVDLVDAGLGLAVHVRADGTTTLLRSHDLPLGLEPDERPRTVVTAELAAGDRLVLATEGVTALPDRGGAHALAAVAAAEPDGAALVARVRAAVPEGDLGADVVLVVLTRA